MFSIPHLDITRIYYRLAVQDIERFSRFPEAGVRGALGYYLYDEYKKSAEQSTRQNDFAELYRALLGPLPGEPLPAQGPQPRSINLRFFKLPQERHKSGLEITFFGPAAQHSQLLEESLVILGEEGIGERANRFYIDGMRPPIKTDLANIHIPVQNSIKLQFYTPTSFRHNRKEIKDWNLEMFSWNLLQRIDLLCSAYGEVNGAFPFDELLQKMLSINSTAQTRKVIRSRLSSRQQKRIDYSGFTGTVQLSNVPIDVVAALAIGEILGVGKNTTFGGGRYAIETK